LAPLLLTFLFIGVGWFILIRPQQERAKAQRAMVAALAVGDRVISAGGIHGTLTEVAEETVRLEVAPGIELTLARPAIARRIDPDVAPTDEDAVEDPDDATLDLTDDPAPHAPGGPVEDPVPTENDGPTTGGPA
jgi:preprotein translocase subunit YajC